MKKIFTNYKVNLEFFQIQLSLSKTRNKQPLLCHFFFFTYTFLQHNYKERDQFLFLFSKTLSNSFFQETIPPPIPPWFLFSTRRISGHPREREWILPDGAYPWTGRGRVIVRIFTECVARGLCVEKILTAPFFHALRRNVKKRRGDIDSRKIVECFSPSPVPRPGQVFDSELCLARCNVCVGGNWDV